MHILPFQHLTYMPDTRTFVTEASDFSEVFRKWPTEVFIKGKKTTERFCMNGDVFDREGDLIKVTYYNPKHKVNLVVFND